MDASELRASGWTHISDLGGPSGVYPAEWLLSELDNTQWWPEKDAIFVEHLRRRFGLLPPSVIRLVNSACQVCPILDHHAGTVSEWPDYQRETIDLMHTFVTELEEEMDVLGEEAGEGMTDGRSRPENMSFFLRAVLGDPTTEGPMDEGGTIYKHTWTPVENPVESPLASIGTAAVVVDEQTGEEIPLTDAIFAMIDRAEVLWLMIEDIERQAERWKT